MISLCTCYCRCSYVFALLTKKNYKFLIYVNRKKSISFLSFFVLSSELLCVEETAVASCFQNGFLNARILFFKYLTYDFILNSSRVCLQRCFTFSLIIIHSSTLTGVSFFFLIFQINTLLSSALESNIFNCLIKVSASFVIMKEFFREN